MTSTIRKPLPSSVCFRLIGRRPIGQCLQILHERLDAFVRPHQGPTSVDQTGRYLLQQYAAIFAWSQLPACSLQ